MLEIAERARARADLGIIAFNAEEDGLLGSRDFVANGLPMGGSAIRLVHVLEMVGFRGAAARQTLPLPWVPTKLRIPDFIGLIAKERSKSMIDAALRSNDAPGLRVVTAKTWGPVHRVVADITRSDHFPFWRAGTPALLWTDTGNFRNPHSHQPSDTPETLDYGFMAEVTTLLDALLQSGWGKTLQIP